MVFVGDGKMDDTSVGARGDPRIKINTESLVKRILFNHKNNKLRTDFVYSTIYNRINFLQTIQFHKKSKKNLAEINKL